MSPHTKTKVGRVLSVRISNSELLNCYDVCEVYGLDTTKGLSSVLLNSLGLFLNDQRERNKIPTYNDELVAGEILQEKSQSGRSLGPNQRSISVSQARVPQGDLSFLSSPTSTNHLRYTGSTKGTTTTTQRNVDNLPRAEFEKLCRPNPTNSDFAPSTFDPADLADLNESGSEQDLATEQETFERDLENELNGLGPDYVEIEPERDGFSEFDLENYEDENAAFDAFIAQEVEQFKQRETEDLLSKILVKTDKKRDDSAKLIQTVHSDKVRLCPITEELKADKLYKKAIDSTMQTAIRMVYDALPSKEWSTQKAEQLVEQTVMGLLKKKGKGE